MNDSQNRPPTQVTEQLHDLTPKYCSAVLQYFHQHPAEAATVDDLEAFIRDLDPPDEDGFRVAAHLHHATLPRLAVHGLINYDPGATRPDSVAIRQSMSRSPSMPNGTAVQRKPTIDRVSSHRTGSSELASESRDFDRTGEEPTKDILSETTIPTYGLWVGQ